MRVLLALLLFSTPAWAHDLDVVYVQLADTDGGFVERITMAAGTLGQLAPVDADNDGELTDADLSHRQDAVRAGVWEQMPLFAGEKPCTYADPKIAIRDTYLELWARFSCGDGELKQELKWLRILPSNYRVVVGSQLDGERGSQVAQGNVQTLYLPRPSAHRAPLLPWEAGAVFAALGVTVGALGFGRKKTQARALLALGLVLVAVGGWVLAGFWFP
ncbi:MAG: hypothetical protein QM723_03420 [Myxococcaceae bacterium]